MAWIEAPVSRKPPATATPHVLPPPRQSSTLPLSRGNPTSRPGSLFVDATAPGTMRGLDVSEFRTAAEKASTLREGILKGSNQSIQSSHPNSIISFDEISSGESLSNICKAWQGIVTGDDNRFIACFWEIARCWRNNWEALMLPPQKTKHWTGRTKLIRWERGSGTLHRDSNAHNFPPKNVIGRKGVAIQRMGNLSATLYDGEIFGDTVAPLVFNSDDFEDKLAVVWAFCSSEEFCGEIRKLTEKINTTPGTLNQVKLDPRRWQEDADERFPFGLPKPYSDDPTQWIFHGHPCGSVVWDETAKWTAHGLLRTDDSVLQVAVARLLGYCWPAEQDDEMELADEQREWVRCAEALSGWADEDGIVCIPSVRGESPAGERLLGLLAAAYGDAWNEGTLTRLLAETGSRSLDDWLRNQFFEQHCKLFHHRPFVWHIWDGRRRDGFHALVSYHRLAEGEGKGRRLLASLTYSYLGDWIARQKDGVQRDEVGAADRLAAAEALQERLAAITEGEPPYDIFVRWKPVHDQPIGWGPDINDGVRLNIRPFMGRDIPGGKKGAGILRAKPNVHWRKDRGKEPLTRGRRSRPPWLQDEDWDPEDEPELRPQRDYPWFWPDDEFTGDRRNDIHLSIADKSAYRLAAERTRR